MKSRIAVVVLMLVALAALAQWSDLTGLRTPAERVAIARLHVSLPPLGERNAYAALWFMRFDMPEEQHAEELARDLTRWRELHELADPVLRRERRTRFRSGATGRYPALPGVSGWPVLCFVWELDCLERVRDDPDKTRDLVQRLDAYLPRLERLAAYDHASSPFRRFGAGLSPTLATPFGTLLSEAALLQVEGKPHADARLCAVSASLRRLLARSDDLATIAAAEGLLIGAARLRADMLAEQDPRTEQAPECAPAFVPLADSEFDLCPALLRDYQAEHEVPDTSNLSGPDGPALMERIGWALFDYQADDPGWARLISATYCSEDRASRNHARARLSVDPGLLLCNPGERLFHPSRCVGKELALPRYADHQDNLLDLDARLTLAALAQRLALLPEADRRAGFERRERGAIEDTHPFALEGDTLSAPLLITRFEQRALVPLPGSRRAAQDSGSARR